MDASKILRIMESYGRVHVTKVREEPPWVQVTIVNNNKLVVSWDTANNDNDATFLVYHGLRDEMLSMVKNVELLKE